MLTTAHQRPQLRGAGGAAYVAIVVGILAASVGGATLLATPARHGLRKSAIGATEVKVRAILARTMQDDRQMDRAIADLSALGDASLPALERTIPALDGSALAVAATVVEDKRYAAAVPALIERLRTCERTKTARWNGDLVPDAILRAVAALGGDSQVAALIWVLGDRSFAAQSRREAYMALVTIGTPPSLRAADGFMTGATVTLWTPWWRPPSPSKLLPYIGNGKRRNDGLSRAASDRKDWGRALTIDKATCSALIRGPGVPSFVLFPDGYIGGEHNLWLARLDAMGRLVEPSYFTGLSVHDRVGINSICATLEVSWQQKAVRVAVGGQTVGSLRLAELRQDSDGDGLPDVVERWIGTAPDRADTDADGLPDGQDRTPNAVDGLPTNEEDQLRYALIRDFCTFEHEELRAEPIFVVNDRAIAWVGRAGATITLSESQAEAARKRAGEDGIAYLSFHEGGFGQCDKPQGQADGKTFTLNFYRGGLNAILYNATVRRGTDGRWRVRAARFAAVS
jgi:hypothetical protein